LKKTIQLPKIENMISRLKFGNLNIKAIFGGVALFSSLAIPFTAYSLSTSEGFENGSKTSYAAATVGFGSGNWNLDNALIGTSTSDRKTGAKSARLQGNGYVEMLFNMALTPTQPGRSFALPLAAVAGQKSAPP
jgi:hypothetical protein